MSVQPRCDGVWSNGFRHCWTYIFECWITDNYK